MKKFLITGGSGFIGSHFIDLILDEDSDYHVVNLDKLTYAGDSRNNSKSQNNKNYLFIYGDISDKRLIDNLFDEFNFDYVVNFAAETHVDTSIEFQIEFLNTNVNGFFTLLNVAKDKWKDEYKNKLFIQISTDEVYGSIQTGTFVEGKTLNPSNPYSATKAAAELIGISYYKTYGFPIIITRSSNNYGPRQNCEKLIPKAIINCLNKQEIPLYGNGLNVRDWIYVLDNCKYILEVIKNGKIGEIYNISGDNELTNLFITKKISKIICGNEDNIKFISDRKGHDFRYSISSNKLKKIANNILKSDFDLSIRETIGFYKDEFIK